MSEVWRGFWGMIIGIDPQIPHHDHPCLTMPLFFSTSMIYLGTTCTPDVFSLANATQGVIESGSLAIHTIGCGLSAARGLTRKHAVKQIDRLLTNTKLNVWKLFHDWVPYIVGERTEIVVSMDWTEFDEDDHCTLLLSLQTSHGRNTPLLWETHQKPLLKGNLNAHERRLLTQLKACLPEGIFTTIVADRGFGSRGMFALLEAELDFAYLIRFKGNILVGHQGEEMVPASQWLTPSGRTRTLKILT